MARGVLSDRIDLPADPARRPGSRASATTMHRRSVVGRTRKSPGRRPVTMGKNIYVGNLPYDTTGDDLVELFQAYGTVTGGQVIVDKFSGRSRGFGFVEMANDEEAKAAIEALNGSSFGNRPLT